MTGWTRAPIWRRHRGVDPGLGLGLLHRDTCCRLLGLDHAGWELPAEQVAVTSLHEEHVGLAHDDGAGDVESSGGRRVAWPTGAEPRLGVGGRQVERGVEGSLHLRSGSAAGLRVPGRDGSRGDSETVREVVVGQAQRALKSGCVCARPGFGRVCHASHCTSAALVIAGYVQRSCL